jgi:hypothetical protein
MISYMSSCQGCAEEARLVKRRDDNRIDVNDVAQQAEHVAQEE